MKTGIHWIERPKMYEVQNSIRASKISALGSRHEVRNEFLSILNDVEQALNDARTSSNIHQQEEVRRKIQEIKPDVQNARNDIERLRKSSLQGFDNMNVRSSNEFPTKDSKFVRRKSPIQRITPFKRPMFEPRKTPAKVIPSGRVVPKPKLNLNPGRLIFWKDDKGEDQESAPTTTDSFASDSESVSASSKIGTLGPYRPNPRLFKREPLALPNINLTPKSEEDNETPELQPEENEAAEPPPPNNRPLNLPKPSITIPKPAESPFTPRAKSTVRQLPPSPTPSEEKEIQLPPQQQGISGEFSNESALQHIQQLISENDEILKNAQLLLDELDDPSVQEVTDPIPAPEPVQVLEPEETPGPLQVPDSIQVLEPGPADILPAPLPPFPKEK